MTNFKVAIVNNKVEVFSNDGVNLSQALFQTEKTINLIGYMFKFTFPFFLFFSVTFMLSFLNINPFVSEHTIFWFISAFIFLCLSGFIISGLSVGEKERQQLSSSLNLAYISMEQEIYEAEQRLKSRHVKEPEEEIDFYSKS